MKRILLKVIELLLSALSAVKSKISISNNSIEDSSYFQLSPISDLQKSKHYIDALNWALKNRREKDIKNIALTGPYGAGKSSILKAFQQNCIDKNLHFLNISLATFKEEIYDSSSTQTPEEKLRYIEVSILQQIFYHEEDNKIPDSRFKKIKVSSKKELTIKSVSLLTAFLCLFWLFSDGINFDSFPNFASTSIFFEKTSLLLIIGFMTYISFIYLKKESKKILFFIPISLVVINVLLSVLIGAKYIFNVDKYNYEVVQFSDFRKNLSAFSILYLLFFFFLLIKELITFLNKISVNKLKFQEAEIEIGSKHTKSIMNQYLDEILYFFSVRPYNVVIIEDLDRFKQTEIFTKLREINLLLNQSEKTKDKNIVFIYAVRDEMFHDKDRTKFFDFIIPIIPTINSSNSSQILLSKNIDNNYSLSESFIENISFIIDDMRLLHNICNEFFLYKNLLSPQLNPEKLFSIITYKNILPNDFVMLSNNQGELHRLINNKNNFISQINKKIDDEINILKLELVNLESNYHKNTVDLRKIYILKLIEKLNHFDSFILNDIEVTFDELTTNENFNYIINNSLHYNKLSNNRNSYNLSKEISPVNVKFNELESEINTSKGYKKLEAEIDDNKNNAVNSKRLKIKELENQKMINRNMRLIKLLKDERFDIKAESKTTSNKKLTVSKVGEASIERKLANKKNLIESQVQHSNLNIPLQNNEFLITFIKNGYIAEDYIEYISIFHEGSINRTDHSFYINVQNRIHQEFGYKLVRTSNLINKINTEDFSTEFIFNYNILDFVLKNKNEYKKQLENLIKKISDESEKSISFIISSFENIENIDEFTKELTAKWSNFWTAISANKTIDTSLLDDIFLATIKFSDIESLKNISNNNTFKQKIYKNPLFLSIIDDEQRIKEIITKLAVDFEILDLENSPKELVNFVYKEYRYEINIQNVEKFIKFYGQFNQVNFDKSNYKAIQESNCEPLKEYIHEYIGDYISNIYLLLITNNEEEESHYIDLLNNEDITDNSFDSIINKVNTKITDASTLLNKEIQLKMLSQNKIKETWENVLFLINNEISIEAVSMYLNDINNASVLSNHKISRDKNSEGTFRYSKSYKKVLELNSISLESYKLLIKSNVWIYKNIDIENLSDEKLNILIIETAIVPDKTNFTIIKEKKPNFLLLFIELNTPKILNILEEIEIDNFDLEKILKSKKLSDDAKNKFLNRLTEDDIILNSNNITLIAELKAKNNSISFSDDLLSTILKNNAIPSKNKIIIYNKNYSKLENSEIGDFIINLSRNYAEIANKDKQALIEKNSDNFTMLEILKNKGFINSYKEEKKGIRIYHKRK